MMERWRRVESLCHAALARPAGERAAFLADACGDDAGLRAEVESLLAGADSAPSFLETPIFGMASPPSLVGRQLGAFRIDAPIGAGGMGEVYRAHDTRLRRDVAVKILPAAWAADPQRRTRFEREARAVAALNHPNICIIHDVGHEQGIDFLVMELVDGESLAARLAKGPLPLHEALARGIEIADALDRAHRQGIIHRDLKPGNVMLARSGSGKAHATQAKLLDFGLARIVASGVAAATTADVTPKTETGAVLGTLQYMAPEQIEGRPADARTDIFAFGALLYEMLAGRRAFEGASTAAVMAAILREEPPLDSFIPAAPRALGRLVRNCLAKDPDDRYASVHDVLLDLRGIAEGDPGAGAIPSPTRWWQRAAVAWAVAALALATAGVLLFRQSGSTVAPASLPPIRATILSPPGIEINRAAGIALSPDGTKLVFRAGDTLWVRALAEDAARELPGSAGAMYPFWSHDSRSIGFFLGNNRLVRMRPEDASPTFVCNAPSPRGGSWSVDDVILFGSRGVLRTVSARGGPVTEVSKLEPAYFAHKWPSFLPDGRHFLYSAQLREWKTAPLDLFLGSLDGTPPRRLGDTWSGAVYAFPGFVLSVGFPGRTLVARRLDVTANRLTGDALPIAAGLVLISQRWTAPFSASSVGSLAYVPGNYTPLRRLTWTSLNGVENGAGDPAQFSELALSPDGRWAVATIMDDDRATTDLWEIELEHDRRERRTDTRDDEQLPVWTRTRNGQEIFYSARRRGSVVDIYRRRPGDANETLVRALEGEGQPCDVSRDGKWLLYSEHRTGERAQNLWLLPLAGGDPVPFQVDRYWKTCGPISPDGRWVLFTSAESGREEVRVRQFPKGRSYPVSRGRFPKWDPSGNTIYYFVEGGRLLSVPFTARQAPVIGHPRVVFEDGGVPYGFAVAPGPRFLRLLDDASVPPPSVTHLTDWLPRDLR